LQNPSQGIKSGATEEDVLYETKAAATDVGDDPLGFGTDLNFHDNPRGCRVNMALGFNPHSYVWQVFSLPNVVFSRTRKGVPKASK